MTRFNPLQSFLGKSLMLQNAAEVLQHVWDLCEKHAKNQIMLAVDNMMAKSVYEKTLFLKIEEAIQQREAAALIQAHWRRAFARISFMLYQWVVIFIQAYVRLLLATRLVASMRAQRYYLAATKIEAHWRRHVAGTNFQRGVAARRIQAKWRQHSLSKIYQRYMAARKIQTTVRRFRALRPYQQYRGAKLFQAAWRRYNKYHAYEQYKGATKFQAAWRRYNKFLSYQQYKGARFFQAAWRRHFANSTLIFLWLIVLWLSSHSVLPCLLPRLVVIAVAAVLGVHDDVASFGFSRCKAMAVNLVRSGSGNRWTAPMARPMD
ncbi:hypothetical protein ACA910_020967 [Epithemia clementina (nom. ined.)]